MLRKIMFKVQGLEPRYRNPVRPPTEALLVRPYILEENKTKAIKKSRRNDMSVET
jgi:hypothetical protein